MRRTLTVPFLGLGLFLFCWINLPKSVADGVRSAGVAPFGMRSLSGETNEVARLQVENQSLRMQLDHLFEWMKAGRLKELLGEQLCSLPAQVIYRDPSSWSSSIWVNVGEESNRAVGRTVVAKNSPVLSDGALVGVVDYVGKKQARIRLITDSGLSPSVRVCRGATQNREVAHQVQALLNLIEKRSELFGSEGERGQFLAQLKGLMERAGTAWEDGYLAKGEVHGSSAPFWRSRSPILKGIGFNFAHPDEKSIKPGVPILKEGDLLVTSGLDGVFPAGLRVGTVSWIKPQREGSYAYEIEVRPAANHLNDLQTLIILPSLSE